MKRNYQVRSVWRGILPILFMGAILSAAGGCSSTGGKDAFRVDVKLPRWFTAPTAAQQKDTPVDLGIRLPEHLRKFSDEYGLPGWVVYGVVRSLGSREFVANGKIKTFTVSDDYGESSIVVDEVYYDVSETEIRSVLAGIAAQCAEAETEIERKNILGGFVVRRFGGLVLFSLDCTGRPDGNLLLTTGESRDAMELFSKGENSELPQIGWRETPAAYITTVSGTFMYGSPALAFRRAEEDAIKELAKSLMLKLSHMRKSFTEDVDGDVVNEIDEDVYCEEITLRMAGVRVLRRAVDMDRGICLVEISVPRSGVSIK